MIQHKKVGKRYKKLPPHSWEPHPLAERGEIRKPYIIAIITIILVIAISLLLFFSDTFVGKAIEYVPEEAMMPAQAGIFLEDNVIPFSLETPTSTGENVVIPIKAMLPEGTNTSAVRFVMTHKNLVVDGTCDTAVMSGLPWGDYFKTISCDDETETITFEYATLDVEQVQSGSFDIATLHFIAPGPGWYNLTFTEFRIPQFEEEPQELARSIGNTMILVRAIETSCDDGFDNDQDGWSDAGNTYEDIDCITELTECPINIQTQLTQKLDDLQAEVDSFNDQFTQIAVSSRDSKYIDSLLSQLTLMGNYLATLQEESELYQSFTSSPCGLRQLLSEYGTLINDIIESHRQVDTLYRTISRLERCEDGIDNDGNDLIDCDDDSCATYLLCEGSEFGEPTPPLVSEICDNEIDDDDDGFIDCDDIQCVDHAACEVEICTDTIDNDDDDFVDCDDPDCVNNFACFVQESCESDEDCTSDGDVCINLLCETPCTGNVCYSDSALRTCTEGYLDIPESCENGCENGACIIEINIEDNICGNSVINTGEACDDGNKVDDDGCSSTCFIEVPSCTSDDECIEGQQCIANMCEVPVTCDSDMPCADENRECINNICTPKQISTEDGTEDGSSNTGSTEGLCRSSWACSSWSYCNASLQQTQTCTDTRRCRTQRTENQSCAECTQSWVCSEWSSCSANQQYRTCEDEHSCGVTSLQPELQKLCTADASGPVPSSISSTIRPPYVEQEPPVSGSTIPLWEEYKYYIIGGAGFILLGIIVLFVLHFIHIHASASNFADLKEWISKEKAMRIPDENIKKALHDQTSWTDTEIERAYVELSGARYSM
ncbi:hypothetical protein COV17_04350 [Candidatus Woesearchaeota archaeon CG10_big_fil_rev_8_21_14_0_10_36_11]|nr:MAG: hypothetical protein COV17_04350 [Candidatus Woesearchaeota archaeon CG10_big_fil_rev_8_21_14_0_10_36_11]